MDTGLKKIAYLLLLTFLFNCSFEKQVENHGAHSIEEIEITTTDSIQIFGEIHIVDEHAPYILLFHQGGSNYRGEYGQEIIPRLKRSGYNIMAIDQRSGGQTYGSYNKTIARFDQNEFSYCDAYPDLEAGLNYLTDRIKHNNKILIWGSSYSGTLGIQLATKNPNKISGILAFSPASGGPMEPCLPNEYFGQITTPLLVLRPIHETEFESVMKQAEFVESAGHTTYIADPGVHGSSMLVQSRVGTETEESWNEVLNFINTVRDEN